MRLASDTQASQIPPVAIMPQDKTGTSMRMLIHDTQANLETFSTRLDGLLQRVDECRAQVVNASKLLDVERDRVLTEILAVSNRCQSELKAHVGTPAQASALDLVRVSQVATEHAVQALEKRIDALQTLLQTHAHAMQSIQDQQNTLIGTMLPLVPLIQNVPPQMDQIKTALSDMVANAVATMTTRLENMQSKLMAESARGHTVAASSTRIGASNRSASQRKRSNASTHVPQDIDVHFSSPLDGRGHGGLCRGLKRARIEGTARNVENAAMSCSAMHLTDPGNPAFPRRSQTPRRPLADLPLPPRNSLPRTRNPVASRSNSTSREYMRPFEDGLSSITTPSSRTPFRRPSHDDPLDVTKFAMGQISATQDALEEAIKIEEFLVPTFSSSIISIHSSPLSSPPTSTPRHDQTETRASINLRRPVESMLEEEFLPPLSAPARSNPEVLAPQSMSLRDRRAQISMFRRAETRRFLPLVPWSDDEE
ncbi:hypothetical protein JVU11DRAFT_10516 [Chiua virens]|nr:hypothetical protein JVU11DRAFT_10516 [Chiua virens]